MIFGNFGKCKIDYGLTSKILHTVITALNGLTVYSARIQAHPAASYGIRAHFSLSTAVKSRQTGVRAGLMGRTKSERPDSPVRHRIAIRAGRFVAGWNAHGYLAASERPGPLRICLSPLSSYCLSIRPSRHTAVGCARRICPCAGIKYTRSRSV